MPPAESRGNKVYIVQMAADPAIRYEGGVAGFAKTAPEKGERYDARTSEAQMYAARLGAQQDALLAKAGVTGGKIYSYRHVLNGFAARMSPQQAAKLRKDKSVLRVWEDRAMPLETDNTSRFPRALQSGRRLARQAQAARPGRHHRRHRYRHRAGTSLAR